MRFLIEQRFGHDAASVQAALLDLAFLARMGELPRLGGPEVLGRSEEGGAVTMRVRYAFAGHLSSAVRRVVDPARLTWVEESSTEVATGRASFRIVPDHYGAMLRCAGTFVLTAAGAGCRRVAEGELRVSVPLVAGKVERAIVSGMEEHAAAEADLIDIWLAS